MNLKSKLLHGAGLFSLTVAVSVGSAASRAQQAVGEPGRTSGDPNPLRNVYFGEQHLHTENSPDAFVVGTRGTWEDA